MNKIVNIGIQTNWKQLSNFYHLKWLRIDDEKWLSVEHYIQAQKYIDHVKYYNIIKACDSSIKAFAIGEQDPNIWTADVKVNNGEYSHLTVREVIIEMLESKIKIRDNWKGICETLLKKAIIQKLSQFHDICNLLINTYNIPICYDDLIISRHFTTINHSTCLILYKLRDQIYINLKGNYYL